MSTLTTRRAKPLRGETSVPGDKSISHRALILGSLAKGETRVRGWLPAGDTLATLGIMRALGLDIRRDGDTLSFTATGSLSAPSGPLDCVNAGTCMRLMAGLMAGQSFPSILDGSEQLRKRPMRRVVDPLREMGASIDDTDGRAPLTVSPAKLSGRFHRLKVASAQVKSAILLAGLFADGETTVIEPGPGRDHTERMLAAMGVDITQNGPEVSVRKLNGAVLKPFDMTIPGDPSSAAFLIAAAAMIPGSDIRITGVGLNETRTGIVDALRRMGAQIDYEDQTDQGGEPTGTIHVRGDGLKATEVGGDEVVRAIDEMPILAIAATQAEGQTIIRDAGELRVKEVDRIAMLAAEMRKLGAVVEERPDGMAITGPAKLHGATVESHGDHRMAMALAVAGLAADGDTMVNEADCADDSFPGFAAALQALGAEVSSGD
jgi:3-phosphoshikimate 1-carboxyvinyltransferase